MTQERISFEEKVRTELAEFEDRRTMQQQLQDVCEFMFENIGNPIRFTDALYVAQNISGIAYFLESIQKD